jgi:5,5'-dehydrodivanillate O-demethylase
VNTTRGFTDDVADTDFYVTPIGIMKKRTYKTGQVDEHPLVFPNILRQGYSTQIRVPMDDTHTAHIHVMFEPNSDGSLVDEAEDPPVEYLAPYKDPPDAVHPDTVYNLRSVLAQDHMAWETQGPIADRTIEHLSYSDRGIHLFRRVTREQIERVQRGLDPMGVIRDPNHPMLDTNIDESTKVEGGDRPVGVGAATPAD